jgi:hypothetical protein
MVTKPMPNPQPIEAAGQVVREWRAAERLLAALAPGTPEWERTLGEVERLRGQYQQLFKTAEPPIGRNST